MERKKRITGPDGNPAEVTEVGFRTSGEHWNEYLLDDGSVIRVKSVAAEFLRLDGQYDDQGNPAYFVRSTAVLNVSAPDELRKEP